MIQEIKKEKIYLIPGLMTDERLWSRLKPFLENEYELIHVSIPHTQDFDEIIDILFNLFEEERDCMPKRRNNKKKIPSAMYERFENGRER